MEQVQSYLELLERQKTEDVRQNVHCGSSSSSSSKAAGLMRPASTITYPLYHHPHFAPPAYTSCLVTSPTRKPADDLSVYHGEQLGSCLGNPAPVLPLVGASLKSEVGPSPAAENERFAVRSQPGVVGAAAYTHLDVHRAGNADSSTCIHSRYTASQSVLPYVYV